MHHVGTITLDFETDDKAKAWELNQRLTRLLHDDLLAGLEHIFDRIDHPQIFLEIDRITIDLGQIHPDRLEADFIPQVLHEVERQLQISTAGKAAISGQNLKSKKEKLPEVLLEFLTHGVLSSASKSLMAELTEEELLKLIMSNSNLQQILVELISKNPVARERVHKQFSSTFFQQIHKFSERKYQRPASMFTDYFELISTESNGGTDEYKPVEKKPLFVSNAGVVLLHPYLSGDNKEGFELFKYIGLTSEGEFVNEEAQERALHVLQYLVWGEEQQPEYELVLDKLLCGMPQNRPVSRFVILDDMEKGACRKVARMLSSIWEGVSDTPLAALQESFLQRLGKLEEVSVGYKLTVEHKTMDILIRRIPYGTSVIKLPWMTEMLWIEWDY